MPRRMDPKPQSTMTRRIKESRRRASTTVQFRLALTPNSNSFTRRELRISCRRWAPQGQAPTAKRFRHMRTQKFSVANSAPATPLARLGCRRMVRERARYSFTTKMRQWGKVALLRPASRKHGKIRYTLILSTRDSLCSVKSA